MKNIPDPIRVGHELAKIYLKVPKSECTLQFFDLTGEESPKLVRSTHWRILHNSILDFDIHAKEVYDDVISDYYIVKFQLYMGDLTEIAKYQIYYKLEDEFFKHSYIKYAYE